MFDYYIFQPPRIGGVKVYKNTKRDEILMDLEVW